MRWSHPIVLALGFLALTGMASQCGKEPSGPSVTVEGNNGPVNVNITNGSSSPVGTSPCGASSSQKTSVNTPGGPDCSSSVSNLARRDQ